MEMKTEKKGWNYPVEIPLQERKRMYSCPDTRYYCAVSTCLQCKSFEINSPTKIKSSQKCGECCYPKKASIKSRKITQGWSPFGVVLSKVEKAEKKKVLVERLAKARAARSRDGSVDDKINYVKSILTKSEDSKKLRAAIIKQFPKVSIGYANVLLSKARAELGIKMCKGRKKTL